jgi:hypothetical protein
MPSRDATAVEDLRFARNSAIEKGANAAVIRQGRGAANRA